MMPYIYRIQRPGGGGKKHEIYVAAYSGHLFYDLFYRAGGAMASLNIVVHSSKSLHVHHMSQYSHIVMSI